MLTEDLQGPRGRVVVAEPGNYPVEEFKVVSKSEDGEAKVIDTVSIAIPEIRDHLVYFGDLKEQVGVEEVWIEGEKVQVVRNGGDPEVTVMDDVTM